MGITCAAAASIGTLVVVFIQDGNNPASGAGQNVVDSKGNTYGRDAYGQSTQQTQAVQVFSSVLTSALTTSDTITYNFATGYGPVYYSTMSVVAAPGYSTADAGVTAVASGIAGTNFSVTGAGTASVAGNSILGLFRPIQPP